MLVNSATRNAERLPVVVLHLLHPAVVLFVALVEFLESLDRVALQSCLPRLGRCLRLAIGGLGKASFRSGLQPVFMSII